MLEAASASRTRRGHWWSSNRLYGLAFAIGAVLLEALPVWSILQVGAAIQTDNLATVALPLWYLVLAVAVARWIGHAGRRLDASALMLAALPLVAISILLAFRISPSAYGYVLGGPLDFTWLDALIRDMLAGSGRISNILGLLLLIGYLWWRGLRGGRATPSLNAVRTTFAYSLAAVIGTIAIASVVRGSSQAQLEGRLAILLPCEVFAGLMALALMRSSSDATRDADVSQGDTSGRRPWLALALSLAGVVVGLALLLSAFISFDVVTAALVGLGPVGEALAAGLEWLIYGFAYLLYLVLGTPIQFIFDRLRSARPPRVAQPPAPPKHACQTPACISHVTPAQGIAVAIVLALIGLGLLTLLLYAVYRSLRAVRLHVVEPDAAEERESLDARGILRAQLRDLLAGLRRASTQAEVDLPATSVRRIYRDFLLAAATLGLGRQSAETPDEYLQRMSIAAPTSADGDDLSVLTEAYDHARYAETEPDRAERLGLRARAERVVSHLRTAERRANR